MSVLSPVISTVDAVARRIYLALGVTGYHPLDDIYAEIRNLRRTDEALRHFDMFVFGGGNIPKNAAGTIRTPRYAIFNNCLVVPQDTSHDLAVSGEQLYMNASGDVVGSGKDCIDKTLLSPGSDVNIDYEPPGSEVFIIETGVSGLTAQESANQQTNTDNLTLITAQIAAFQIRPPRGVALDKFPFYMVDSSDSKSPATGKTPSVEVAVPGVGWAATTNTPAEQGQGWYYVDLTGPEMNGEFVMLRATATGADVANLAMMTAPVV